MRRFYLITAALLAAPAYAGGISSGGGNVIVCYQNVKVFTPAILLQPMVGLLGFVLDQNVPAITFVESYDLYRLGFTEGGLEKPAASTDQKTLYRRAVHRLRGARPDLADEFVRVSERLDAGAVFQESIPHFKIDDTGAIWNGDLLREWVQKGVVASYAIGICHMALTAIQSDDDDGLSLQIDQRLYGHPANTDASRGVLFVHEVVRNMALARNHLDGGPTVRLTSLLISENELASEVIKAAQSF